MDLEVESQLMPKEANHLRPACRRGQPVAQRPASNPVDAALAIPAWSQDVHIEAILEGATPAPNLPGLSLLNYPQLRPQKSRGQRQAISTVPGPNS